MVPKFWAFGRLGETLGETHSQDDGDVVGAAAGAVGVLRLVVGRAVLPRFLYDVERRHVGDGDVADEAGVAPRDEHVVDARAPVSLAPVLVGGVKLRLRLLLGTLVTAKRKKLTMRIQ